MNKKVVIIGAGGHGKAIADIIEKSGDIVYGFLDDNLKENILTYKILGKINNCEDLYKNNTDLEFIIAIGNNRIRKEIYEKYKLKYYTAIHPKSNISNIDTEIKEGTVIMANACVNTSAKIGKQAIINTGTIIEHDCLVKDFAHISYGCIVGANTKIGENSYIGLGSIINIGKEINKNEIIECGSIIK